MRLLLDTHTLIWWWSGNSRLPEGLAQELTRPETIVFVSAVSAWEIATKRRLGKLPELDETFDFLGFAVSQHLHLLAISVEHGERGGRYRMAHADPFDRILAAQSELENIPLVTLDTAFDAFPCETRW